MAGEDRSELSFEQAVPSGSDGVLKLDHGALLRGARKLRRPGVSVGPRDEIRACLSKDMQDSQERALARLLSKKLQNGLKDFGDEENLDDLDPDEDEEDVDLDELDLDGLFD
jgi:hypothetical protein